MNIVDLVILLFLIAILGSIIYFSFIKNRNNPCHNCPYCNNCNKNKCLKGENREK